MGTSEHIKCDSFQMQIPFHSALKTQEFKTDSKGGGEMVALQESRSQAKPTMLPYVSVQTHATSTQPRWIQAGS